MSRAYWKLPRLLYPNILYRDEFDINSKNSRSLKFLDSKIYYSGLYDLYNGKKAIPIKSVSSLYGFCSNDLSITKIVGSRIIVSQKQKLKKLKKLKKKKRK
jgi:hypothetical protein